jgi:SAM-dependent methyltransferase
MDTDTLIAYFNNNAENRDAWIKKNSYYNQKIVEFMQFHIPPDSTVLEIGCGTGFLLNALRPKKGVGIDFSEEMTKTASHKYPHLHFITADALDYHLEGTFDYIILADTIGYFRDIQGVLKNIRQNCTSKTRIIITIYNFLWEPILKFAEALNQKMKQPFTNWLAPKDVEELLCLEDFDVIKSGELLLFPKYFPLLASLCNKYLAHLPLVRNLCLAHYLIARSINLPNSTYDETVSIVVPARNEQGNIEEIARTLPRVGRETEIIFIEGGSKDNTWEEIIRVSNDYKDKKIKFAKQDGTGKGAAVRKGFDLATGNILMIYDADMTVPATDIDKFYKAVVSRKGELIIGNRLVYPLEKDAMRILNVLGNKFFSLIFTWLLGQRIKDTLCGTKVIAKENYEVLKQHRNYFGDFDPFGDFDLIFGASKRDLKIVEVPIRYQERKYGETNIRRFYHGWRLLKMCFFAMRKIKFV